MVATSATRDAGNAAEFVREVTAVLGTVPEVLSGADEARLSFTGATAELPAALNCPAARTWWWTSAAARRSSCWAVRGEQERLSAVSVDIGCVRLTERHLHSDPPAAAEIAAAGADIDAALDSVAAAVPAGRARTLVGLAGSVTTLAGLALGLPRYDSAAIHHARMSAAQVAAQTRRLLAQTRDERARLPVMHPGRVDVIGGGALVLDHVMRRFGFAEVLVSEHDILDGIAWSLASGAGR